MRRALAASLGWGFASINSRLTANRLTSRSWPSRFGVAGIACPLPLSRVLRLRRPRDPRLGRQRLRLSRLDRRQFRWLPPSLLANRRRVPTSSTRLARPKLPTGRPPSTSSRSTKRVAPPRARDQPKTRPRGHLSKTPAQILSFRARLIQRGPNPSTSAKMQARRLPPLRRLPRERRQLSGAGPRAWATSWRLQAWTSHLTTAPCPYRSPISGRPLRPHLRQARAVGSIEQ